MVKKFINLKRSAAAAGLLFVGGVNEAFAQYTGPKQDLGNNIISGASQSLVNLSASIVGFLQILLGIAALVSLFVVVYNIFKQERDAAQKAIWWVVGLAAGWAALTVVGNLLNSQIQAD